MNRRGLWWIQRLVGFMALFGVARGGSITFDGLNMTTNGSATLTAGGNLQLIPDDLGTGTPGHFQDGSAFITAPVAITQSDPFSATFSYLMTNSDSSHAGLGLADGFGFVIQSYGLDALGAAGRQVGYAGGPDAAGITPSVAVLVRTFAYNDIEIDQDGNEIGQGSAPQPTPSQSQGLTLYGGQYDVSDTGTVTVSYDGAGTLTVTGYDSAGDVIDIATTVDLSALGGTAFIGFTGASGSGSADEEITSFTSTLDGGAASPEPGTGLLLMLGLFGSAGVHVVAWSRKCFVAGRFFGVITEAFSWVSTHPGNSARFGAPSRVVDDEGRAEFAERPVIHPKQAYERT